VGSYAKCWLDNLLVGSSRNDIDPEILSLFRPKEKIIIASPTGSLPAHLTHYREAIEEDPELKFIYYEAPLVVVKDRLNVLGYDIATAKEAFRSWISEAKKHILENAEELANKDSESRDHMEGHFRKEFGILSSLSPESWIENLKLIHASGLETNEFGRYEGPHEDTAIGYMLSNDWYGYPGYDLFVPLRLAIEAVENSQRLIYDLTDLAWAGYFDYDEDFVEYGLDSLADEYSSKSKTIVLTEGKTDAWVLSETLGLLYPHLQDYFSFLDFENTGFGGGVGNLANVVKAFAGAGIVNNVIALFDNDTAAASACKALEKIVLPSNIAIRHLPELELLKKYPTIGPSGSVDLDVNGMAASIELYFGEDVLRVDGINLIPIQWTGYDKLAKQYQGEVLDKSLIQGRFKEKIARAHNGEEVDWKDLDAVFQLLFSSFLDKNRKIICKRASEYYS
jgi:hypothetical protein